MHLGRQLLTGDAETTAVFTDWMSRGGDKGVFTVELLQAINAELEVIVFHKNSEETGSGASAGTLVASTSSLGLHKATIGPLEEMVRYRIEVTGGAGGGSVLYRLHETTWFDTARV